MDGVEEDIQPLFWSEPEEDIVALRSRLREDGYLALGGVAPTDLALQVRRDIFEVCLKAG